ncbi:gem-associated protein 5 isoform X2 [Lepisosteus oculatus]|uniref:gem-associated protein 5 isoform X2 n=1 Tax=Lepisosteus oculatus TaxID=7918 RepID=UPI0035F514D7
MSERLLSASPNWYCSRSSDTNVKGVLGFGAKNSVYLLQISSQSPAILGELTGHRERVSGFTFCRYPGQEDLCASCSDDGTVKVWDSQKRALMKEHKAHQSTITALHWSPIEKDLVVSGDEKGVVVCYWHNRNDTHSFFPEPRNIFCLSCSPHNENHIAVGYKDGMVIVIDISKKNEVVHRLRGHDDEIHGLAWCPQPGEEALYSRPAEESAEVANGEVEDESERGCYLASGSKDQTIRLWSTRKGKGVMTLKLPFLKRRGVGVDPAVKERLWLTVHWPQGQPTHIVSSCFGGELLLWDLVKSGKQKWAVLGPSSEGQNHSRIVFNMSSTSAEENRELLISISMDRDIKCWDLSTLECCWTLPSLGGFVYALTFSPVDTGSLALGVGDNMIRVWSTLSLKNKYDTKAFWQGVKSKVTALSWHPLKEGCLAFGTDDGKIGIYEAYSSKPPQISSTYHRKTVYTVAWGPPIPPLSFGDDRPPVALYSCAGEGVIFQHNPWKLAEEATDVDKVIRDTNSIKHKLSPHTDLSWKPDGKILAIGNEDGSVDVFQAPHLQLLCTIQQHHKIINALCWHHEHSSQPDLGYLLASGSSNAVVYVHNLKSVIEAPPDSPAVVTEPYRSLAGHTAKITGLSWSPHHDGRLVSVCYDGTAQVWDVLKEEAVCNYRGHKGRLLCVQWSPVDPDVVWTGGDDFTVQEWAVSKQEHTKPPKGKKGIELEKKRTTQPKPKAKKKKKQPSRNDSRSEDSEVVNGEEEERGGSARLQEGPAHLEEEEEEKTESQRTAALPRPAAWFKESRKEFSRQEDKAVLEKVHNGGKAFSFVKRETIKDEKKREKQETAGKKRKPRSVLPLSSAMDHRPKEELHGDCLALAAVRHGSAVSGRHEPGAGDQIQLGLFADRKALYRMFEEEEKNHVEAGHCDAAVCLLLWKGDIAGALQLATEKGELTEHLVSVAPMAGYQVWSRTVEAFVKQLCFQEQFVKAASYLLSIQKVYEAVDLLKSQQLYREAIALAKARLRPEDPVLKDLYTAWAAVLESDGHYSTAAKCYLATDSGFDAAKVIAKKGDVTSLKVAAEVALILGENDLSHLLSLRCARELLNSQDWLGAQEVLKTQEGLLAHRLLYCTNELLVKSLAGAELINWSSASTHRWALGPDEALLRGVGRVWEREFGVSAADVGRVELLHQQLKTVENPAVTVNIPTKQLLSQLSLDLTLALLSSLGGSWGAALEELLQAASRCRDAGHLRLMKELCARLFPCGLESVLQFKEKLDSGDLKGAAAVHSLEAFVCYLQLYELWWGNSDPTAQAQEGAGIAPPAALVDGGARDHSDPLNGSEGPGEVSTSQPPDAGSLAEACLSEPHALLQATRRALADLQQQLSSMVQQHRRAQDGPAEAETEAEAEAGPSAEQAAAGEQGPSEEPGSLIPLVSQIAEQNRRLDEIPEDVKRLPFPDVVECCLVLLHMDRAPEDVKGRALGLVQQYGNTDAQRKACQKFCTKNDEPAGE